MALILGGEIFLLGNKKAAKRRPELEG